MESQTESTGAGKISERRGKGSEQLLTKLNFLNHILSYYGWVDQAAWMMRSLIRETRSLWEENHKAFLNVIFKDHRYFREAEFTSSFNEKQYMFLMKAQRYASFRWKLLLSTNKEMALFTNLLENITITHSSMFSAIKLGEYSWDIDIYNKFIEALHVLGSDLGIIQTRRLRFNGLGKDKIIEYLPSDHSYTQGSKIGKINGNCCCRDSEYYRYHKQLNILIPDWIQLYSHHFFCSSEDKNIITNLVKPLKFREGCHKVVFHSSTSYEDDSTENDLVQNDFNRFSEIIEIFPNLETLQINTQVLKIEYLKFLLEADRSSHIQTIQFNYKADKAEGLINCSMRYTCLEISKVIFTINQDMQIECENLYIEFKDDSYFQKDKYVYFNDFSEFKISGFKIIPKTQRRDLPDIVKDAGSSYIALCLSSTALPPIALPGIQVQRHIKCRGTHRDLSTEEHKSDFLFTESETGTNSIHVEYILSRMKFKIPDFISEIDNLDRTCSIEITYNRPPGTVFEEFQQVIDAVFCKRLTTLRINLCFLPEDCEDYLLEKIKESKTLLELYINFRKEVYGFQILDSLQSVQSLRYLELQCRVSHTSELHSKIDEFISTKSNQVIVKIPDPKKPRSTMWLYKDSASSCPIIMPPYPVPQSQN
ncbi:unnamed protein product [Moneuplotes crassus]|uniref:Uncharacterized protein n=2 Tax=Euplotes crassus TaxID=5936 RepID=A0AAD2D802_EUPCR|nr:unnamed protein product [Moneuplotes crassus]